MEDSSYFKSNIYISSNSQYNIYDLVKNSQFNNIYSNKYLKQINIKNKNASKCKIKAN